MTMTPEVHVDATLQERFNAKVMALWPFGPQYFFCNAPVKGVSDLKGLKVRSYTPSMTALVQHLGAIPVTLQFSEVYPALQRGLVQRRVAISCPPRLDGLAPAAYVAASIENDSQP